jgi:hypothetical protein
MPTHEVEILAEGRDGIRSLVLSGAIVTRTGGSTASRPWTPSGQSLLCRKHHRGGDGVQGGVNMIGHGIRQAIAEDLALGVKAGVEPEAL